MANNHPSGLRLKEALRWLKANKKMEQKDVAVTMGTSETTVSRNIRAALDGRPNADFILKLSETTGVPFNLQYIVNGTGTLLGEGTNENIPKSDIPTSAADNMLELYARMIRGVDDLRVQLHAELQEVQQLRTSLQQTVAALTAELHRLQYATPYSYGMAAEELSNQ